MCCRPAPSLHVRVHEATPGRRMRKMMQSAVPEFELQQELQRFTTQFADRITQATDVLEQSPRAEVRDEALRKNLLYVSSAMEIATGPFPEVSLLDMIVFI